MKKLLFATLMFLAATCGVKAQNVKVGDKMFDFTLTTPKGEEMSLSQFQGKMVLIDFWASWCGPCRKENPKVIAAYNKYKNKKFRKGKGKGLVILSVSLDNNKADWEKAIAEDGLFWDTHVSDLKKWDGIAKTFGLESIPTNILVDGNGKVIAIGLRGDKLLETLKKL